VISAVALANFQPEGHSVMNGIHSVVWNVVPNTPPRPRKHCSTCGESRPFGSSGKIRLNANGRKLDAWLIYKCASCEKTWNLPLLDRTVLASITVAELQAMHRSDPDWVRAREFDLSKLKRHCDQIEFSDDLSVTKTFAHALPQTWSAIDLTIDAPYPTGQRLDRFLAGEMCLTRSALQSIHLAGGLHCGFDPRRDLNKSVTGSLTVRFVAARLTESQRAIVSKALHE
jgi:hypothetical protein